MSFERFSSSDVYIFEHVDGFIECCGCSLAKVGDSGVFGFTNLKTPREALAHLDDHEAAGDDIGGARARIEKAYPDLDITIKTYEEDPEVLERIRQKIKEAIERSEE